MNSPFKSFKPALATDDGIQAARMALAEAAKTGIHAALCGGIAMHLYGFTRATQDVDIVADSELGLLPAEPLNFGGKAYTIVVSGKDITVDWIVRNDELRPIYAAALMDSIRTEDGLPVVAPEWLVIVKHLAGRGKDHLDALWLLRQDGMVDRAVLKDHVRTLMGPMAFWAVQDLESLMLEADLLKAKDERGDRTG